MTPLYKYSRGRPRKYHNQPIEVDGVRFDSKKEARRWEQLRLMERASLIADLKRQVSFDLAVNGHQICRYVADFTYTVKGAFRDGQPDQIVEDSKGVQTPEFKLKAKLMKAIHGIEVRLS